MQARLIQQRDFVSEVRFARSVAGEVIEKVRESDDEAERIAKEAARVLKERIGIV